MKYEVGDRVKINAEGFRLYGKEEDATGACSNPTCEGTITQLGEWLKVDWDNGTYNSYRHGTVDVIGFQLENE